MENTRGGIGKKSLVHNGATPAITVDPETYAVTADGVLLVCEPADKLQWRSGIFYIEAAARVTICGGARSGTLTRDGGTRSGRPRLVRMPGGGRSLAMQTLLLLMALTTGAPNYDVKASAGRRATRHSPRTRPARTTSA